jgi:type I restriction enzyme M protein
LLVDYLKEQLADVESDLKRLSDIDRSYSLVLAAELRNALSEATAAQVLFQVDASVERLRAEAETLELQARDAQAAGDRLYWPIYNLNLKNPNAPEEESHDPDVLLEKYKTLLGQIEETENQLKSELAAALAHHFSAEAEEA